MTALYFFLGAIAGSAAVLLVILFYTKARFVKRLRYQWRTHRQEKKRIAAESWLEWYHR